MHFRYVFPEPTKQIKDSETELTFVFITTDELCAGSRLIQSFYENIRWGMGVLVPPRDPQSPRKVPEMNVSAET